MVMAGVVVGTAVVEVDVTVVVGVFVVVVGCIVVVGKSVVVAVDAGSMAASESDDGRRPFWQWTFLRQSHTLSDGWNSRPMGHLKE